MFQHNGFSAFNEKKKTVLLLSVLLNNSFLDSDLALRNCLLTSDMSVKIGDYGLSHSRFKVRRMTKTNFLLFFCGMSESALRCCFRSFTGGLLRYARPDLGAPPLDRTRAHRRGPRKPASCRPNKIQQHMVRAEGAGWNVNPGLYCLFPKLRCERGLEKGENGSKNCKNT